jgi:2-aminoadipate transaminase
MTEEKNYKFSEALSNSNPSFIREILKLTAVKDMISFAGGLPDANLFPKNHIKSATLDIFEEYGNTLFQYTTTEGLYSLRTGIRFSGENIYK